jgi:hypothetical protein
VPQQNINFSENIANFPVKETVCIPVTLAKSTQGKYFVGKTEVLLVGGGLNAWAGLVNPQNSKTDLFVNVFTVSNFSDSFLTAEIWLNTDTIEKGCSSDNVSPTNTSIKPPSKNKAELRFIQSTAAVPKTGVNVYDRIVPPKTTLVGEEDGKFIEAPCGNYVLVIKSSSIQPEKVIVAFGWWEEAAF